MPTIKKYILCLCLSIQMYTSDQAPENPQQYRCFDLVITLNNPLLDPKVTERLDEEFAELLEKYREDLAEALHIVRDSNSK